MARIDYHDDPERPPADSMVPSTNVVAVNDAGDILLIHRTDDNNWSLPGGAMQIGESLVEAARRETIEETGIEVEITGLGRHFHRPPPRHRRYQQRRGTAGVLGGVHRPTNRATN